MSNEAKSRIMLWLFILFCCFCSFLMGRVARADTYSFFTGGGYIELDFNAPAGSFQVGQQTFIPSINYLGGIVSAAFYIEDSYENYFDGFFLLGQIIA